MISNKKQKKGDYEKNINKTKDRFDGRKRNAFHSLAGISRMFKIFHNFKKGFIYIKTLSLHLVLYMI